MLQNDVLSPSTSPCSAPVVLVHKNDGTDRFCVDYRRLNPLPCIQDMLDVLHGAKYFSTMDLLSGYHQVAMHPNSCQKTAFATHAGLFEFNAMPFGLSNARCTFQRLMECVLRGLNWDTCLIYLDDIIVFSNTFEEHLKRLCLVLNILREAN